ncbi:MAG: serine hydrolase [Burkholderiales bacterium]|nr:serine hydrolase [Burkholderiales bacterium]
MKNRLIPAAAATPLATGLAQASKPPASAADSDPVTLGWMVGSPPPADKLIRWADMSFFRFPQYRWTFANFRQLLPTTNVSRGDAAVAVLPRAERSDIDGVSFQPLGSTDTMTWARSLEANYTDAIIVLHKGRVVYERYFGVMDASRPHAAMSVTKSLFGTLAAMLVAEGTLDPNALVTRYIPELKDTAYGDASVREVMDMTVGVKFSEDYADPQAEIWEHLRAGGVFPRAPGSTGPQGFQQFLLGSKKEGEHGQAFGYKTINSDVLGWLIARASGEPVGRLFTERIWSKLGAEHDAYMIVDSTGYEFAGGGFNATLRDMARFGEMMRLEGRFNGQQIVPRAVVDEIRRGGSQAKFAKAGFSTLPGWRYHDMWWLSNDEDGAYAARGIHGQTVYIDPKAEMVIARFASHPQAANAHLDPTSLPAYRALGRFLMR